MTSYFLIRRTDDMLPLLTLLAESGVLKADSIVIAEHFKKQLSPDRAGVLSLYREAKYGDTVLAFYTHRSQEAETSRQETK